MSRDPWVWQADVLGWFPEVWNFKIFEVDGSPITLGKIIVGAALLFAGYFACRRLARLISNRVLSRFEIEESLKYTLETIIFYILMVILTLFILRLLNVPITIFTVVGGALAIGVGFGSQAVVSNFISGLIVMIERPVRVGDFVQVGDLLGTVRHIGARSTQIVSADNTNILIPNSVFLESTVINWTLSDDVVRRAVNVGVAYGSPTREVEKLLIQAVNQINGPLKHPAPLVYFVDFGDNTLNFRVHFWIHQNGPLDMRQVESDLRHQVNQILTDHKISIAFPQRDVHLDTASPLQIQLLNSRAP